MLFKQPSVPIQWFKSTILLERGCHQRIIDLYPRVLITPHIGSATDMALIDMIEVTLKNMDEFLETGDCKNSLIK